MAEDGQILLAATRPVAWSNLCCSGVTPAGRNAGLHDAGQAISPGDAVPALLRSTARKSLPHPSYGQPRFLLIAKPLEAMIFSPVSSATLPDQPDVTAQIDGRAVHHGGHAEAFAN